MDYISGKRIAYYNIFYLILIIVGLIIFSRHFLYQLSYGEVEELTQTPKQLNEASKKFDDFFSQKSKLIILLFIPLAAFNSFILFRKIKLNLSEHTILSGMVLLGMLLISLFGNYFFYLKLLVPFNPTFSMSMSIFVTLLMILHMAYGYINAFNNDYSKSELAAKIFLFFVLIGVEILILFFILYGIFTNWKFGWVELTPFC